MSKRTDVLVQAINEADEAHNANVARGATAEELRASYLACLRAQLGLYEDERDSAGVAVLKAEIAYWVAK